MKLAAGFIVLAALVFGTAAVTYSQYDYSATPQPQPKGGADLKTELKTAITHAGFAGSGDSLNYVRQHVGHALNCIEGPSGKNFNRGWGNVCQGQGNGILVDLKSAPNGASFKRIIESADALAVAGVASADVAEAKTISRAVAALLTVISDNLK